MAIQFVIETSGLSKNRKRPYSVSQSQRATLLAVVNDHQIKIELFGIPRLRAGVAEFFVSLKELPCPLQDVFREIDKTMPALGKEIFTQGKLRAEFIANISGRQFTRSPDAEVLESDSVLILSSDAGG